jgi:hypothetical protein
VDWGGASRGATLVYFVCSQEETEECSVGVFMGDEVDDQKEPGKGRDVL